jgi:uncharacterized membrane protein YhiD involved in acid resistance
MSILRWFPALLLLAASAASAQPGGVEQLMQPLTDPIPGLKQQLPGLVEAAIRLPLAALLGASLAFRPRRRGTPPRHPTVIQTQILLAIVGAVVMLIVGQSLARAFGIVGVASLVRYRAKIEDPKDAGVMLATLGIGLASGVGLYLIAAVSTLFLLGFLWWVESIEPKALRRFHLTVATKDAEAIRPRIETLLRRYNAHFELRSLTEEELKYELKVPFELKTEKLSNEITALNGQEAVAVEWDEKKQQS